MDRKISPASAKLLHAAVHADLQGMQKALAAGADVDARDDEGQTALMICASDYDPLTCPSMHPIATLPGEPEFLAVDVAKKALPVLKWSHDDGKFYPVAPSLKALVARLTPK